VTSTGELSAGLELRIRGLEKSFPGKGVLRGVELAVRPSEFVAVVGKSGCGKSTLLRLIAGLDELDAGSIAIADQPVSGTNPRLRMVFQDHRLLPWKNALQNVAFCLGDEWTPRARAMLEHVGLADHENDFPRSLSGGEKQRVSLARALLTRPGLLLFDEPLGALDALTRIDMQRLIERVWLAQRFSALLITHDVDEAIVLADRIVIFKDGVVDLEVEVTLPRPRPRTGAEFDRIKELVLDRILRTDGGRTTPPAAAPPEQGTASAPRDLPAPAPTHRAPLADATTLQRIEQ
jgi:sulfonate transport system ATP-binding protein